MPTGLWKPEGLGRDVQTFLSSPALERQIHFSWESSQGPSNAFLDSVVRQHPEPRDCSPSPVAKTSCKCLWPRVHAAKGQKIPPEFDDVGLPAPTLPNHVACSLLKFLARSMFLWVPCPDERDLQGGNLEQPGPETPRKRGQEMPSPPVTPHTHTPPRPS